MQSIRDSMRTALDTVHANQAERQEKNKVLYDRKVHAESFKPGDEVLALQPLDGKPLEVKYLGPFQVIRQTSPVDYLVQFTGHRKSERNLHVNLLRRYNRR